MVAHMIKIFSSKIHFTLMTLTSKYIIWIIIEMKWIYQIIYSSNISFCWLPVSEKKYFWTNFYPAGTLLVKKQNIIASLCPMTARRPFESCAWQRSSNDKERPMIPRCIRDTCRILCILLCMLFNWQYHIIAFRLRVHVKKIKLLLIWFHDTDGCTASLK